MAANDRAFLVDLRSGTILFVLAIPDSAAAQEVDAVSDRFGSGGRDSIPNRLRRVFGAIDRALGLAIRQS